MGTTPNLMEDIVPVQCRIAADIDAPTLRPAQDVLATIGAAVTHFDCLTEDALINAQPHAILVFRAATPISRRVLESITECRIIARCGIGVDNIDLAAASELGIRVTNVPDYCIDEVSVHTVVLLLACARKIPFQNQRIREGVFGTTAAEIRPIHRFAGSTVGIVGFGRIGSSVARKLAGFEVRLLVHDPYIDQGLITAAGATPVSFEMLLRQSDFVTLHCPLTPGTRNLIGERELAMMKPMAILINTTRGRLIDQSALTHALQEGIIAGAGLDVYADEPIDVHDPLLSLSNTVLTPHSAWYSEEAFVENFHKAAGEIVRALQCKPAVNAVAAR